MKIKQNLPGTDRRRADGIGSLARRAYYLMGRKGLHGASLLIGAAIRLYRANRRRKHFAATNNSQNSDYLGSDEFIDEMIERGCSAGLITEYLPCGQEPRSEWVLNAIQREQFRQRILGMRSEKPIVLVQFPQDEYGEANICSGAGRVSLHINSQGGIEPCPFVPLSCDNIRQGGLLAAVKSTFLASIRSRPNLLARDRLACSLYEHFSEVEALLGHSNTGDASNRG